MLTDSRTLPDGKTISADICIIGGGAAGITLARELGKQFSVLVIESGGMDADPAIQDLYRGSVTGNIWKQLSGDNKSDGSYYLHTTRTRFFGGSTNCWAGFCRPLDASVFSHRPWIPNSGWPIRREQLDSYYEKAAVICGISGEYAHHEEDDGRHFPQGTRLEPAREYASPAFRFGQTYRDDVTDPERIRLYLNGSVTDIACNPEGDAIERVTVKTLAGNTFTAESSLFILATGGIENARLLLAADSVHENGIGNSHDQLGRYFMDHLYPKIKPGIAALTRTHWEGRAEYNDFGIWTLPQTLRRNHGLLNIGIAFEALGPQQETLPQDILSTVATIDQHGRKSSTETISLLTSIRIHIELAPLPENRITLSEDRDSLGVPRVQLDWVLGDLDRYSIDKSMELFSLELGRSLAGRIAGGAMSMAQAFGAHHTGTTRMSEAPDTGVVNPDCRVHGIRNLYVAGSSVFPTSGFENPTFTVIALALRLADHIKTTQ